MNNMRRKAIDEAITKLNEAMEMLQVALDEEQVYYDNMPEGFQYGEKGEVAEAAIDNLQSAVDGISDAIDSAEESKA